MQPPILGWTTVDDRGIARLKHDAIDKIFLKGGSMGPDPASPYAEYPSRYLVTLRGEKRKRRVYITFIGNAHVKYLKTKSYGYHREIFCEVALDEALNRAEDD